MANALAHELSPYLRQHAGNPVDWRPWGPEALSLARERDVPLLVSIGYSACHWCHVMERECFEDQQIAQLMNDHFVCVKVDREERPDVDAIYMEAVQAMTGQGGWPLHAFLTPEGEPFYGGTYFPPQPRQGMASWPQVLLGVARTWQERREEATEAGRRLAEQLGGGTRLHDQEELAPGLLEEAVERARAIHDGVRGGFGGAPKFPPASLIDFLLRRGEREMALGTLRAMASGGICDQIGGGFARYSVDANWTVPHFEKMLYDNALLARAYLHGWQASGEPELQRTCRETLDFCLRELRDERGGFFCALDADSEGVEGRFYVWSPAELHEVLGPELAPQALAYFGVSEHGNFEGTNVLEARGPEPAERARIRAALLAARAARVRPALDDKLLCAWNALMISALAEAGAALEEPRYLAAAEEAAGWLLEAMRDEQGRLLRTPGRLRGYLEDHAFLLEALLTLYEASWEVRWFAAAREIADEILARFADQERGGFFSVAADHEQLIVRRKELEDTPIPSGPASASLGLLRLSALTGESRYEEAALGALRLVAPLAARHPASFGHTLQAMLFALSEVREVALVGARGSAELARVVRGGLHPALVLAGAGENQDQSTAVPLLRERSAAADGSALAYVCTGFSCRAPVAEPERLRVLLQ